MKKDSKTKHLAETFLNVGATHVYKNKKTIVKSVVLLFIPFFYAFITLWAFFDPLGNINRLPIALVNEDTSEIGDNRILNLKTLGINDEQKNSYGAYPFDIDNVEINNTTKNFHVYYYDDEKTFKDNENKTTFLTTILVNENFTAQWNHYFSEVFSIITDGQGNIWQRINNITDQPEVSLTASFKVNPILGEINEFALNTLKNNIFGMFFPVVVSNQVFQYWYDDAHQSGNDYDTHKSLIKDIYSIVSDFVPGMSIHQDGFNANVDSVNDDTTWLIAKTAEKTYWMNNKLTGPLSFINFDIHIDGQDKAPYGFGLGPYFMCIGMWVGGLVLTFTFNKGKKELKQKTDFWANYLAKSGWMIIFGFFQATILTTSLLLLFNSTDLFIRSWELFLYMWFLGFCFDMIIQGIVWMFRSKDIGRFLVVLLLILQLSASSGTFPVQLEPGFFQVISHFLPFTYGIQGLREIIINPNIIAILTTVGVLLIFVAVIISLSLLVNYFYDLIDQKQKHRARLKKKPIRNRKRI